MNLNRKRRRKMRINHFLWHRHTQQIHRRTFIRSLLDREATKTTKNYRRVRCGCCQVMLQNGKFNVPSDLNWRKASFNRSIRFNHFNGIKFNYFQCSIGERGIEQRLQKQSVWKRLGIVRMRLPIEWSFCLHSICMSTASDVIFYERSELSMKAQVTTEPVLAFDQ